MMILVFSLLTAGLLQIGPIGADQPGVEVLKYGWRRLNGGVGVDIPHNIGTIDNQTGSPMILTGRQGYPPGEREKYEYKIRFKNTSSRTVRRIVWAYVFADPATNKELVRRRFKSDLKIAPNTEKERREIVNWESGPPMLVSAAPAKKGEKVWKEGVIIEGVRYSDGSKWKPR